MQYLANEDSNRLMDISESLASWWMNLQTLNLANDSPLIRDLSCLSRQDYGKYPCSLPLLDRASPSFFTAVLAQYVSRKSIGSLPANEKALAVTIGVYK